MSIPYTQTSDAALPALLDREPDRAMEALVEKYSPLACHVAAKYLSDPEDVKECVNDAFTEVYLHRSDYSPERGSLAVWIGTITRNRAVSMYRKRSRDLPLPEDGAEADSHGGMAGLEESLDIERALSELSETDRRIIRMKYYEGMSTKEIAESLHLPYETVKKRHTRSIKSLRRLLLTLLIAAILLVLAACGVIRLLQHFGVLPGYGVTTDPRAIYCTLEEEVSCQSGPFTVTLYSAAFMEDQFLVRYTLTVDPALCDVESDGRFTPLDCFTSILDAEGNTLEFERYFQDGYPESEGSDTLIVIENFFSFSQSALDALQSGERVELILHVWDIDYFGTPFADVDLPFAIRQVTPEDLEDYPYLYSEETGGFMVNSRLEGDTLLLDVYPLSNGNMEYWIGLTNLQYGRFSGPSENAPVTIVGEDGAVYSGEAVGNLFPMALERVLYVTYAFQGVEPGKYTLTLPYVYLLAYQTEQDRLVWNLEDCTFSEDVVSFAGIHFRTLSIEQVETPADMRAENFDLTYKITARYDIDNEEMSLAESHGTSMIPFKKTFIVSRLMRFYLFGGPDSYPIISSGDAVQPGERDGELVYLLHARSSETDKLEMAHVTFLPANRVVPICIRYDHPVELEFEVTE